MISLDYIRQLYKRPFLQLISEASAVHKRYHNFADIQLCTLLSVKTGGCEEDCAYCPQAARYHTDVRAEPLMEVDDVLAAARKAREAGATRFCMGAAWREVKDGPQFDRVLEMVRGVKRVGMEACCTLGMLTAAQAGRLKEAGLDAYNHNLDTSRAKYGDIITTRTYDDRLRTLDNVRRAGISVCCGGILGMGESVDDRCEMLRTLAAQEPHPESVPINMLVAIAGTPLAARPPVSTVEMVRAIATARILMPRAMVRLSAGRQQMSEEAQLLCMMAGANSVFFGEKLLTTGNPEYAQDMALFEAAGIAPLAAVAP